MSPHLHHLCQTRSDYRQLFFDLAAGRKPGKYERPEDAPPPRKHNCIHLGRVIDRAKCGCIHKWVYECEHEQVETTTLAKCRGCEFYEADNQAQAP